MGRDNQKCLEKIWNIDLKIIWYKRRTKDNAVEKYQRENSKNIYL